MTETIIGVIGPGKANPQEIEQARELGGLIAREGWTLLTGGRDTGVMEAASEGAHKAGGLVVGILPTADKTGASDFIDIPICTGMGSARNNINVLTSDIVIAIGQGAGTTSEIMLALKAKKPLILLTPSPKLLDFIDELPYPKPKIINAPKEIVPAVQPFL